LTILDCNFAKNLTLYNVALKITKFTQIYSEKLKPTNINIENNVTQTIKQEYCQNSDSKQQNSDVSAQIKQDLVKKQKKQD
jgi:hypothetical protein